MSSHPTSPRFQLCVAATPSVLSGVRRDLRGWLKANEVEHDLAEIIVLVVNEACSNAVEHPVARATNDVRLEAALEDGQLHVTIQDDGHWDRSASDETRGRGLELMHALVDKVDVTADQGGTTIRLIKAL